MRLPRTLVALFAVLFVSSCIVVPPPKGSNEPPPEEQPEGEEPEGERPEGEPEGKEPGTPGEPPPGEPEPEEEAPPPPPAPPKTVADLVKEIGANDWVHLAHKSPGFEDETAKVVVTRKKGGFSKLALVVADAGLEIISIDVTLGNGDNWAPKVKSVFNAGSRTRKMDLPGKARFIKHIVIKYKSTDEKAGKANLHIFGKAAEKPVKKDKPAAEPEPEKKDAPPAPSRTPTEATDVK